MNPNLLALKYLKNRISINHRNCSSFLLRFLHFFLQNNRVKKIERIFLIFRILNIFVIFFFDIFMFFFHFWPADYWICFFMFRVSCTNISIVILIFRSKYRVSGKWKRADKIQKQFIRISLLFHFSFFLLFPLLHWDDLKGKRKVF